MYVGTTTEEKSRRGPNSAYGHARHCQSLQTYSPSLGRFLQADPIGYADNSNLYAYVGNDPVNFADPLGLAAPLDIWDIIVTGRRDHSTPTPDPNGQVAINDFTRSRGEAGDGDARGQDIVVTAKPRGLGPPSCNPCNATLTWAAGGDIVVTGRRASAPFYFNGTAWVPDLNYVKPWYSNYFDACFVLCPPIIAAGGVALTPGTGEALFARGGLLNDNPYVRVGTGTGRLATRTNYYTNFRVSIGGPNNALGIWWHIDLPWIPTP